METSKPKRQKVTTACDPCRSRKVKCDGHQPVCGPCEKRSRSETACTWATDPSRIPSASTEYIRQLEDRIRLLEGHNNQIQGSSSRSIDSASEKSIPPTTGSRVTASSSSPEPTTWQTSVPWMRSPFFSASGTTTDLRLRAPATSIVPPLVQPLPATLDSTDSTFISANHSVRDIVVGDGNIQNPADSTIATNFMQEVEKAITAKLGEVSNTRDPSYDSNCDSRQNDLDYPLPSRQQADNLLSSYWNYVHVLYPFLDKSQVEEDYETIWNQHNSITDKNSFLCLLNSIFAISSRHVRSADPDHGHLAATYCLRARELLKIDSCSVRSVQSYLLLALYFQSIDEPRTCWMFAGLAIRTAQILELHLIETSERESEGRAKELLRKVWHGCVLIDREISMMYGRPCMIDPKTASAIPLPLLEEENFQLGHVQSDSTMAQQTHAADFHSISLGLYDILHEVLLHPYPRKHFRIGCSDSTEHFPPFEANTFVVELEERLSKWERNIPDCYKIGLHSPYKSINGLLVRRAVILRQRHLHVHLLLLRPLLQGVITSEFRNRGESIPVGSLLSHRVSLQCAIVCVKVAQEAIDTIYVNEGTSLNEMRDLSAWWHNAIFLYTSATVLIAASLSPSVVAEVSEDSIYDSFHKAIAVLRQYTIFNPSILRLTTALHILSSVIPKNYSRFKQASQQTEDVHASGVANNAATFQYWCPVRPNRRQKSPPGDPKAHENNNQVSPSESLSNLDLCFDPDDFTWLVKIPFYT